MRALHVGVRVQHVDVRLHHLLERDHGAGPTRHGQQARTVVGQLDLGEVWRAGGGAPKHDGEREAEMREMRQRVPRTQRHGERREPRVNLLAAPLGQRLALGLVERLPAQQVHAVRLRRAKDGARTGRLRGEDPAHLFLDARQPRHRGEPVFARRCTLRLVERGGAQAGHPHHVQLVDVRGDDGDEAEPLAQRRALVLRQRQHAALEGEETELRIEHLGAADRPPPPSRGATGRTRRAASVAPRAASIARAARRARADRRRRTRRSCSSSSASASRASSRGCPRRRWPQSCWKVCAAPPRRTVTRS